nr:MAG TPA: hypothetical protein [Caudoviricetes sp.]
MFLVDGFHGCKSHCGSGAAQGDTEAHTGFALGLNYNQKM